VVLFSADSDGITRGQSTTLRWLVSGASHARIEPEIGTVDTRGARLVSPLETTEYTLTAKNEGGTRTARYRLLVEAVAPSLPSPPPVIESLEAAPDGVKPGDAVTLRWRVIGAARLDVTPGADSISAATNSVVVRPMSTTEYRLTAANAAGASVSRTVTVNVTPPPTIEFAADLPRIEFGRPDTLRWSVANAANIAMNGSAGVPGTGTMTVSPRQTVEYTLTAQNSVGTVSKTVTIRVSPRIAAFDAVQVPAGRCEVAMLRWTVQGAAAISIEPGVGAIRSASSYVLVRPRNETEYVLKAISSGGESTRTAVVPGFGPPVNGCR
jgi:hypothetical protein